MKKINSISYSIIWAILFAFYVLLHVFINPHEGAVMFIAHIIFLLAVLLIVYNCYGVSQIYGANNKHSDAFKIVLIGFISIFIGNLITIILKYGYKIIIYPSPADLFYIIGYPFVGIGLFKEIQNCNIINLKKGEKKLIYIVLPLVLFFFFVYLFYNPENTTWQNVLNIFNRYAELLILLGIFVMARFTYEYKRGTLYYPWLFLSIGGILFIIVGILYNIYWKEFKAYNYPYSLLNAIWLLAYIFIGIGLFNLKEVLYNAQQKIKLKLRKNE